MKIRLLHGTFKVFFAVGMLLLGVLLARWLLPESPPSDQINIAWSEYRSALAKWRAQGIDEYEITVDVQGARGSVKTTLRVSDQGNDILLVERSPDTLLAPDFGSAFERMKSYDMSYYRHQTIEGMFEEIADYLNGYSPDYCCVYDFQVDYHIQFHPEMGYPILVSRQIDEPLSEAGSEKKVVDLKVIKRGASVAP